MAKGGKGGSGGPDMGQLMSMYSQMNRQTRPTPTPLQTAGYGGMGYNLPQASQQPAWATGQWAMPWYGQAQQGQSWGQPRTQAPTPNIMQGFPGGGQGGGPGSMRGFPGGGPGGGPGGMQGFPGGGPSGMQAQQEMMRPPWQWAQQDPDYRNMMQRQGAADYNGLLPMGMATGKGGRGW